MEKRIGAIIICIEDHQKVEELNAIISKHSEIIIGRQGIPLREYHVSIISLVVEGPNDTISSLAGQLGIIKGIKTKSIVIH
jgi:putative iron-only hydrogenase system regulator